MGLFWATEDSTQVSASDVSELRELTERLAELMRTTSVVRCTSAGGTDVVVPIGDRRVTAFYSIIDRPGAICTIPYYAEAATAPVEGGTEGIIVVDTYMHWLGRVTSPIALHVEGGRVVDVTGGPQSARLKEIIAGADDNATNIAELGIGTCRIGVVRGTSQDKALIGTAHLGIGHNHSLGGSVISNVHLDGVFKDATLTFDGQVIMQAGRFML